MEETSDQVQQKGLLQAIITQSRIKIDGDKFNVFQPQVVKHPSLGYVAVFLPSYNFEKNKDTLLAETGFGFQMMSLNSQFTDLTSIPWSEEQSSDSNNPHIDRNMFARSVVINERLYIFTNLSSTTQSPLKIVDFNLRRIFPVQFQDFKPSTVRVNYSISHYKQKVYLYGGIDEQNQIISTMDEFDATTYKFTLIKYRGDFKPKGRQGHCAVGIDQYNMFIIGGSYQESLLDPTPIPADETIVNFDIDAFTFQQVPIDKSLSNIPNLLYPSGFIADKDNIGILYYDFEASLQEDGLKNRILKICLFSVSKRQFKDINLIQDDFTPFKFGHSILVKYSASEDVANEVLIFGGIDQSQPNKNTEFVVTKVDFANAHKLQLELKADQKQQKGLPSKKFEEDQNETTQSSPGSTSQNKKKKNKKKSSGSGIIE